MIIFNSSGRKRKSRLRIRVFMHTDLPLPVAPAISRCGASARSRMTGCPLMSLPSAIGIVALLFSHIGCSSSSRNVTGAEIAFGTSIPTVSRPGMGVRMRRLSAFKAMAMLFCRLLIFSTRTPGAGLISNSVTRGPLVVSPRVPSMPKLSSVSCRISFLAAISRGLTVTAFLFLLVAACFRSCGVGSL